MSRDVDYGLVPVANYVPSEAEAAAHPPIAPPPAEALHPNAIGETFANPYTGGSTLADLNMASSQSRLGPIAPHTPQGDAAARAGATAAGVNAATALGGEMIGPYVGAGLSKLYGAGKSAMGSLADMMGSGPAMNLVDASGNPIVSTAEQGVGEVKKLNELLELHKNDIRKAPGADLEDAATMPGRGLAKEGITSKNLEKMEAPVRAQRINDLRLKAGKALDTALDKAEDSGKTFDIGKSAQDVFNRIKNEDLQKQAINSWNQLGKEQGIKDFRNASPQAAKDLRDTLSQGLRSTRFNIGGDLTNLSDTRVQLYRALNRDLYEAFPELQKANQHYSDLKVAADAASAQEDRWWMNAPGPGQFRQAIEAALKYGAGGGGVLGGGYGAYRTLKDMMGNK